MKSPSLKQSESLSQEYTHTHNMHACRQRCRHARARAWLQRNHNSHGLFKNNLYMEGLPNCSVNYMSIDEPIMYTSQDSLKNKIKFIYYSYNKRITCIYLRQQTQKSMSMLLKVIRQAVSVGTRGLPLTH